MSRDARLTFSWGVHVRLGDVEALKDMEYRPRPFLAGIQKSQVHSTRSLL